MLNSRPIPSQFEDARIENSMNQRATDEHLEVCSRQDELDLLRTARVPDELTIASFNIRYAAGSLLISGSYLRRLGLTMPSRRPALIAKHLSRAARAFNSSERMPAPDIIALQEADKHTLRAGQHHIARELAAALNMNYALAESILPREASVQPKRWWLCLLYTSPSPRDS